MKSQMSTERSTDSTCTLAGSERAGPVAMNVAPVKATWPDNLAKKAVFKILKTLQTGRLEIVDGAERHTFGPAARDVPGTCVITVQHPGFYSRATFGGTLGCAESYMDGQWTANDLTAVVQLLIKNLGTMNRLDGGLSKFLHPLLRFGRCLRRNSLSGSRKNIAAHYDLSNEFFALFLDDTMMYSGAFFERNDSTLSVASTAKNDRLCRKLKLSPDDHLLEIGTGWGGFAIHAAKNYGCRVTTTTISKEQYGFATERIAKEGLSHKIAVLQDDYRLLTGQYDKIVSIEMLEAVGSEFLDVFFKRCSELLKPHGAMALQVITIQDRFFDKHARSVDFINKHIFPGSCLLSVARMLECTRKHTDLNLSHLEEITPHYARTLRLWRERFNDNLIRVRGMGFGERFVRMWEFYLCYCEAGFSERYIGAMQLLFAKPECKMTVN